MVDRRADAVTLRDVTMMPNRIASLAPMPGPKRPIPLMPCEHIKQCLQVAKGRVRADAAIIMAVDRYERDRRRALAFVKGGAMCPPTRWMRPRPPVYPHR
jgi:hypothetical protein